VDTAAIRELNRRFGIPDSVRIVAGNGGLAKVDIATRDGTGEMYVDGAHITSWQAARRGGILFIRTEARWDDGPRQLNETHANALRTCGKHFLLLIILLCFATIGCDEKSPPLVATPVPVVLVAQPIERAVTDYQIFTARTEAVQSTNIRARVTGYLTRIAFQDGDMIKEGDVLFEIDDRPYKAALDEANATLQVSTANLDASKAGLEIATADLVTAQAEYEMDFNVRKTNAAAMSQAELDKRLGMRDAARGGVDKAKAAIAEAESSIQQAKAALMTAQLNYDWCKVTAPISGRTTRHLVDVGDLVSQNVTILTNIVSLKPIWAYINVDQNTAQRVQTLVHEGKIKSFRNGQMPVDMSVGVGSADSFPIAGTVDYVSNQFDPNTGSIQVRCAFPNEDESLIAGLFATIKVPIGAPHEALLVSGQAIGTNQGQKYVLVVNDKNEVEYRAIETGQLQDGLREVARFRSVTEPGPNGNDITKQVEVLKPGDWVIVNGLQRARPGVTVDPRKVDMLTMLDESHSSSSK